MVKSWLLVLFILAWTPSALAQQPPPGSAQGTQEGQGEDVRPKEKISKIQLYLKPFDYDREIYRDPFEAQTGQAPLEPGQVYGPFLEIQTFRLADFVLKGLLWDTDRPVAIFQAPNEKIYKLTIKDYIGENFGYIATIREKEVVVIQTIEENERRYSTTKVVFLETVQGE